MDQTNASKYINIDFWIQGAKKIIPMKLKPNEKLSFEIDDVAVIGKSQDIFEPIIVLHWSNEKCAYGIEYEKSISDISFSKTDIGTLIFDGLVCNKNPEANTIRNISWTWDGNAIGFSMIGGLRKIKSKGQSIFATEELLSPSNNCWPDHMAWSPKDNNFLYYDFDLPTAENTGLYLASEGGNPQLLVKDAKSTPPAWLPDGSGFLYVKDSNEDKNIYQYHFQSKEKKRLTYFNHASVEDISISDDGKYAVFELCNTWVDPAESDLWIIDLNNPANIWQITNNGKNTHPDWGTPVR
jgi:hypothetical protein